MCKFIHFVQFLVVICSLCSLYLFIGISIADSLKNSIVLGNWVDFINLETKNDMVVHWNSINGWNFRCKSGVLTFKINLRMWILASWSLSAWRNHRSGHRFLKANTKCILFHIILQINFQWITNYRTTLYRQSLFLLLIFQQIFQWHEIAFRLDFVILSFKQHLIIFRILSNWYYIRILSDCSRGLKRFW